MPKSKSRKKKSPKRVDTSGSPGAQSLTSAVLERLTLRVRPTDHPRGG